MASEVFSSDCSQIFDKIFESPEFFHKFFAFINSQANDILAGYFSKTFLQLIIKNPPDFFQYFSAGGHFGNFTNLISFRAVGELIVRVVVCDFSLLEDFVEERKKLVQMVIDEVGSKCEKRSKNAGKVICDVIVLRNDVSSSSEIFEVLMSEKNLQRLFDLAVDTSNEHVSEVALTVIKTIMQSSLGFDLINSCNIDEEVLFKLLVKYLPIFAEFMENQKKTFLTSFNETVEMLGESRLRITEIVLALIKSGIYKLISALVRSKLLTKIVDLLWKLEWNSIYHVQFHQISQEILFGKSFELKVDLLKTSNFLQAMIKNYSNNPRKAT